MVRRLLAGLLLAATALPAAAHAGARRPAKDSGRIDVGAGYQWVEGGGGPAGLARFSWYLDPSWSLGLELGYGHDAARLKPGSVQLGLVDAGASLSFHPVVLGPIIPYAAVGGSYRLVELTENGHYHEGGTQAVYLGLGAWAPLGGRFGAFVEDRYIFSSTTAQVAGKDVVTRIGGNMLWAGLVVTFEPEPPIAQ